MLHAAEALLTVLALQGAIGYTQYFTGVPPLLVGLHVLGATLVWVASLRLLLVHVGSGGAGTGGSARIARCPS